ncbi:unnamed protein product [Mytilus coruscus]|uniref:Reverse transcriptase zinc-binding domain-containing protein n=1 Tax=Mytilus coruscus TaxID=42192 RepID=A0A6J8DK56_MYTCO|nr:unnamed protein product [Mytilus coruscus]
MEWSRANKRTTLNKKKKEGGIQMPDIEEKINAMWLQKIIDMIKGKPTIWKTMYTAVLTGEKQIDRGIRGIDPQSKYCNRQFETFEHLFIDCKELKCLEPLPTSLCNIANDPFVVNPHEIKDLCHQLENNTTAKECLHQVIYTIVEESNSKLTQSNDRENIFRKLHKVRSDVALRQKFLDHFPTCSENVLSIFLQMIFEDW